MDFFKKILEKKECSICQKEIGLLGNRKLEDGNMCKECEKKLSPWFAERRHTTVEDIQKQLSDRMLNYENLKDFHPTTVLGDEYKMHIEDQHGIPYRFVVSKTNSFLNENADLLYFSDISSCMLDIQESNIELKYTNSQKERVSYNPPRYEYRYDFYVIMRIMNNPYFDEIRFKLNPRTIKMETEKSPHRHGYSYMTNSLMDPTYNPEWQKYKRMYDDIEYFVNRARNNPLPRQVITPSVPTNTTNSSIRFCSYCGTKFTGGLFCKECGHQIGK